MKLSKVNKTLDMNTTLQHRLTQFWQYLDIGERGLKFDMSKGVVLDGVYSFPRRSNVDAKIIYPYLAYGTAGIASVLLRYYVVTKKSEHLQMLNAFKTGISHKYTIGGGLYLGLAGLGNYMLDAFQFLGDATYLHLARRVCDGIRLFEIPKRTGSAFPMMLDSKITCDYSNGSAGIALFLNRLKENAPNHNFMIDELLTIFLKQSKSSRTQNHKMPT